MNRAEPKPATLSGAEAVSWAFPHSHSMHVLLSVHHVKVSSHCTEGLGFALSPFLLLSFPLILVRNNELFFILKANVQNRKKIESKHKYDTGNAIQQCKPRLATPEAAIKVPGFALQLGLQFSSL